MEYSFLVVFLFISLILYFRIADKYDIIDKPNERSSHSIVTLRGGGVVYWMAAIVYMIFNHQFNDWLFFLGLTLVVGISFYDDINGSKPKTRLVIHLTSVTLIFMMAGVFSSYAWGWIVLGYIVFVGILNAWNFMDGINGITGLYSIAALLSLQYINLKQIPFVNPDLIWYPMIASVVFLFFNFRKTARCFAGDVGSVSIAFWVAALTLMLMIESNSLIWIGFMMVYGVDSVMTILHRIYLRHNIFEAHRLHFYQIMANELGIQHRIVSVIYFLVQILVSFSIIKFYPIMSWWIFVIVAILLTATYLLKFGFIKRHYATA